MISNFKLNHAGAAEVLKTMAAGEIAGVAKQIADNAGGEDDTAWVHTYTTDRAAAAVTVPAGRQAKHGALTRAAAAAGLEVRAKGEKFVGVSPVPNAASKRGQRWTADEIRGIFDGSAADVARRTGRSLSAVRSQRQSIARGH